MRTLTVEIPALHPSQAEISANPARFKYLACGRRWGKTRLGSIGALKVALTGGRAWWVAPSYKLAGVGWRLVSHFGAQLNAEVRRGDRLVRFPGGGEISVRSADNPDSLRSEGLDFVVLDECSFMVEEAWTSALRPALADRVGGAMFISTPKGHNWFFRAYMRGLELPDCACWQLPTADNPYIDAAEIEAARRALPDRVYRQEFLAEFIEDGGGVIRNINACRREISPEPIDGREYVFGVDWGKSEDFTVITVFDAVTQECVWWDRFNQIDYFFQLGRLKAMAERYRPTIIVAEANAMGGPLIEAISREGLPVVGFTMTQQAKMALIEDLSLAFEREEIGIPDNHPQAQIMTTELQALEVHRTGRGNYSYGAPAGMHDDIVISLALGWSRVKRVEVGIVW